MQITEEASPISKAMDSKIEPVNSHADNAPKSLIGNAVIIKGNIAATENMEVGGKIVGGIVVKNSRLEISDTAQVDADVYARNIIIKGKVKGKVTASDQVLVANTGHVEGDINAPAISMEDGAFFKGNINMEKQEISWEESIPDIHDDSHEKASSFGFLFRRARNPHADHMNPPAENAPVKPATEEVKPIIAVEKRHHESEAKAGKSFIGKTVLVKGHIESEEDMIISGEIVGNIYFKSNSLEVGPQAHINGNIFVKDFTTYGESRGDICAEFVSIRKPAHLNGVIHSPRVSIESGASFQGKVEMEQQNIEEAYARSIAPPMKEKSGFLGKASLDSNLDDLKSGLQGAVNQSKSKRVPWPE